MFSTPNSFIILQERFGLCCPACACRVPDIRFIHQSFKESLSGMEMKNAFWVWGFGSRGLGFNLYETDRLRAENYGS